MILDRMNLRNDTSSTSKNSTLMLRMVTSYSIFLLVILVLFFFLYRSTMENAHDSYDSKQESIIIGDAELFEQDLDVMEVYCRQLLQDSNFRHIMNADTVDDSYIDYGIALKDTLATNLYAEALLPIKESFVYFPLTDYVLNSAYFISADRFYSWIQKYDAGLRADWDAYLCSGESTGRFLPIGDFMPGYSEQYYMYIIDLDSLYYLETHAKVCFLFRESELLELFSCEEDDSHFMLAMDAQGVPILSLNVPENITLSANRHTTQEIRMGGERLTVGTHHSKDTGYTYYYSYPAYSTGGLNLTVMLFLAAILVTLLIGGALIYHFSRRNVRPILELGEELQAANEVSQQLQEVVDNQRPIICTSYVRQLLTGTVTTQNEAAYMEQYLGLPASSYYNVLSVIYYNNYSETTLESDSAVSSSSASAVRSPELVQSRTAEELKGIIENALVNFFDDPIYFFSPAERTYTVLIHCKPSEEQNLTMRVSNQILRLHNYLLDTYDIWLFAGMGRTTDSLINTWECCQQAQEAANYTTKNYVFFPYEFIKKDSNVFYYPPEISTKLIHFVTTGNTDQVLELFGLIHQENIEERSLPINLLKYLLSDIRNTLLKARFELPSDTDPEAVKLLDERFNEPLSFKLCEDLALALCKLFAVETDDTTLASTIEKYIRANYTDPSLGLNKISDEFQISESYFSHMFKEKTGVNFSTYLENIRMTEAARLIKDSDISLNELYIAVGYNNSNSFRRAFKKVYGMTPSAMRETS